MADTSGPFDGIPWAENEWYRHMPSAMPSGVIGGPQTAATLGPLAWATSGLTVNLAVGNANVGGAGYSRGAPTTSVSVAANTNSTLFRRDRIVLRRSTATNNVVPTVIQGTPAATPVAPSITRDATTFDLPLFSFLVPTNSGTALSGVVDERVWLSESASPVTNFAMGYVPLATTSQVGTTTALIAAVTVPAVAVPSRLIVTALGRTGFAASAQEVGWDWDGVPGTATNVVKDYDSVSQVATPAGGWAAITASLTMDLPANADGGFRLILRTTGPVYNRGAVIWNRGPQ
jgi:hypothetical protein